MQPAAPGVLVRIPRTLMSVAGAHPALHVPLAAPVTVTDLLDLLGSQYPVFDRRVRDETGALRRYVNLYLDGEDVRRLDGLSTRVRAGQEVQIIQSVAGG